MGITGRRRPSKKIVAIAGLLVALASAGSALAAPARAATPPSDLVWCQYARPEIGVSADPADPSDWERVALPISGRDCAEMAHDGDARIVRAVTPAEAADRRVPSGYWNCTLTVATGARSCKRYNLAPVRRSRSDCGELSTSVQRYRASVEVRRTGRVSCSAARIAARRVLRSEHAPRGWRLTRYVDNGSRLDLQQHCYEDGIQWPGCVDTSPAEWDYRVTLRKRGATVTLRGSLA